MKNLENNIKVISADNLKEKSRNFDESVSENDRIRIHRSISWLKCAEEQKDNPDLRFISLWIAFNSCYADNELNDYSLTERQQFNDFISKLVAHDHEELIFELLWHKFTGPIRLLIDNKYAFKPFWDAERNDDIDWQRKFKQSKIDSRNYLAHQQVAELLGVVLDRLYTVRNQLLHGGATYKSKVNRSQVQDASQILEFLIPIVIDIMIANIDDDWGEINYPVVN